MSRVENENEVPKSEARQGEIDSYEQYLIMNERVKSLNNSNLKNFLSNWENEDEPAGE